MGDNPLQEKAYDLAIQVVQLCKILREKKEYVLSQQLLKSGTSVGANIEEAQHGQSRKDFIAKLSIALKEAHETCYWLRIIRDSEPDFLEATSTLLHHLNEVISLLTVSIKTSRKNLSPKE